VFLNQFTFIFVPQLQTIGFAFIFLFTNVYGFLSYQTHLFQSQSIIIDQAQVDKSLSFDICNSNEAQTVLIVASISLSEKLNQLLYDISHKSKLPVLIIISGSSI
jgi:hypothetical protein